jgi:hypothetical protein
MGFVVIMLEKAELCCSTRHLCWGTDANLRAAEMILYRTNTNGIARRALIYPTNLITSSELMEATHDSASMLLRAFTIGCSLLLST